MALLDFFRTGAALKKIPRQGWIDRLSMGDPESVADHSYMTALVSMVASDMGWGGCDTGKVLRMALLHDLAEARTGDLTPGEIGAQEKRDMEDAAFGRIVEDLPEPVRGQYLRIWEEYQLRESPEAVLVHQIDRLEMALQAETYRRDGGYPEGMIEPFMRTADADIADPRLRDLLAKIIRDGRGLQQQQQQRGTSRAGTDHAGRD